MSFREKSAWISLLSILAVYAFYFGVMVSPGAHSAVGHFGSLLATVIALVIVQVVLTTAAAVFAPKEASAPRDERDRLIELRATQFAYAGLATGIACACCFGALDPPIVFDTNALLFVLVTAELMRSACQIVQYRRSG